MCFRFFTLPGGRLQQIGHKFSIAPIKSNCIKLQSYFFFSIVCNGAMGKLSQSRNSRVFFCFFSSSFPFTAFFKLQYTESLRLSVRT